MVHIWKTSFLFPGMFHLQKVKEKVLKAGRASCRSHRRNVFRLLIVERCTFHIAGSQTQWHVGITWAAVKYTALGSHVSAQLACVCVRACAVTSKCSKWAYDNWCHYQVTHCHLSRALGHHPFLHLLLGPFPVSSGTCPKHLSLCYHTPTCTEWACIPPVNWSSVSVVQTADLSLPFWIFSFTHIVLNLIMWYRTKDPN